MKSDAKSHFKRVTDDLKNIKKKKIQRRNRKLARRSRKMLSFYKSLKLIYCTLNNSINIIQVATSPNQTLTTLLKAFVKVITNS